MGQMAEPQTSPPPPAATCCGRPVPGRQLGPRLLQRMAMGRGVAARAQTARRRAGGPRAADARSAKVTPQGALLPARAPARCQALARPSPGSAVMKEIKVPTTTRAHCAQL